MVLITGGLGFIGLELARTLVGRGMTVRLLDNLSPQIHGAVPQPELGTLFADDRVEMMRGDVCNRRDWVSALHDVGAVVHLAAETGTGQSMYRIGDYTSTNVLGTALLMDVLANDRHEVTKLILASSRACLLYTSYSFRKNGGDRKCIAVLRGSLVQARVLDFFHAPVDSGVPWGTRSKTQTLRILI